VNRTELCRHCGRIMGDYGGGWATINGEPVCHPNSEDRPDCYRLCTVGHHDLPCSLPECVQDQVQVVKDRLADVRNMVEAMLWDREG
jgi:hypothetical protein